MRYRLLLSFLFLAFGSLAQNDFWKGYAEIEDDTEKLAFIKLEGGKLLYSDPEALWAVSDSATELGQKLDDPSGVLIAEAFRASIVGAEGHRDSAIALLNSAIQRMHREAPEVDVALDLYNLLSIQHYYIYEFHMQSIYNDSALIVARRLGKKEDEATLLFNRAHIMSDLGRPMVTDSLLKAVLYAEVVQDNHGLLSAVCYSLSHNFIVLGLPDSASHFARQGIWHARKLGVGRELASAYLSLARAQLEDDLLDSAEHFLDRADSIYQGIHFSSGIEWTAIMRLRLLVRTDRLDKAESIWNMLRDSLMKNDEGSKAYAELEAEAAKLYRKQGRHDEAYEMLQRHITDLERFQNRIAEQQLAELEIKHQTREKQRELKLLKAEQRLSEQRQLLAYTLGLLLIIVLIAVLVLLRVISRNRILKIERDKERLKNEVETQVEETRHRERQLATKALYLTEKNELLKELLDILESSNGDKLERLSSKIKSKINLSISSEQELKAFQRTFEETNPDFFKHMKATHPSLTDSEVRLLAFVKIGLSIKEIAVLTHVEANSVKTARYRLKKKLGLSQETSLEDYVMDF